MGTWQLRDVLVRAGLNPTQVWLRYDGEKQVIEARGTFADGKPFDLASDPFADDPIAAAHRLAAQALANRKLTGEIATGAARIASATVIAKALVEGNQARKQLMAGEIRDGMKALRAARDKMRTDILAEITAVTADVHATRTDGLEAMKLPRAELEAAKQEIREIRAEYATASNGDPNPGPLPGAEANSAPPSTASGAAQKD